DLVGELGLRQSARETFDANQVTDTNVGLVGTPGIAGNSLGSHLVKSFCFLLGLGGGIVRPWHSANPCAVRGSTAGNAPGNRFRTTGNADAAQPNAIAKRGRIRLSERKPRVKDAMRSPRADRPCRSARRTNSRCRARCGSDPTRGRCG